jgi:hypothetical protein
MFEPQILLGLQLSLKGKFHHVPETLVFRRKLWIPEETARARYFLKAPVGTSFCARQGRVFSEALPLCWGALSVVHSASINRAEKLKCALDIFLYYLTDVSQRAIWKLRRIGPKSIGALRGGFRKILSTRV